MRALLLILAFFVASDAMSQPAFTVSHPSPGVRSERAALYPDHLAGRRMADGSVYDARGFTAAHQYLPLGSTLRVKNPATGRSVTVRITDRGPFLAGVEVLVSGAAGHALHLAEDEIRAMDTELVDGMEPLGKVESDWPIEPPGQQGSQPKESNVANTAGAGSRSIVVDSPKRPARQTFAVQLGSFAARDAADELASTIEGAWVAETEVSGRRVFRIYFGRYGDRTTAQDWAERLSRLGKTGFVKTIPADR